ncbi:tetratricopeptide repeat protein [Streptomyces sp. CAU 1734]|uniref:tetratricopeptide repeat protein n=1 Tax=Streptomyces sp. CAU 1734 TaxID=3140360 RepID=UPI0032605916
MTARDAHGEPIDANATSPAERSGITGGDLAARSSGSTDAVPGTGGSGGGNTIGGSAHLHGPTIQAREVHGGIHVHTTGPGPAPPVPRQLPPVPAHFINRKPDLAALGALSTAARPLIVVSGPPGVGKTTLVSNWLRTLDTDFPDGQLYADLRGHSSAGDPATQSEILGQFLRALGAVTVPLEPAEQSALWRSTTAGRRIVVMLDNAFTAAQVRPLLPGGPGCLVAVTSRRLLSGLRMDGAAFHRLASLDAADGVELLRRGIGEDRVAGELTAAHRIVSLCDGLPLAVALASARLASRPRQPVEALADALARDRGRLTVLEVEGEATVHKALDASYAVLSTETARLYRTLGALPMRTFDAHTSAAACAESLPWAERRLDELVEANLVEDLGPAGCRFHDLVRVHAQDRAHADDSAEARTLGLRRVCEWYLEAATAAQRRLTPAQLTLERLPARPRPGLPVPFTDDTGALAWLDGGRERLMTALRHAAEHGWHAIAWQLTDAMWPLFLRLRHYDLWIEAHRIGVEAARGDGSAAAERQMLNSGAIGLSGAGRIRTAVEWYERSLHAARTAGDARDEGQALLGLGACHRELGLMAEAVPYLNEAIGVWESCGYPRGSALARTVLGEIALAAGDPAAAIAHFSGARAGMLAVDDPHDAARALAFLGRARVRSGDRTEGMAELHEALAVFTASGAAHWQARTLEMLADSAAESGDAPAAVDFRARSLSLYETTSPADARRLREPAD